MSEAWWCPSVDVPGEEYDGRPLHRGDFAIRSLPHSIIVNRAGQRFVNEAHNYNDMMKPFFAFDPVGYERPNLPAWLDLRPAASVDKYVLADACCRACRCRTGSRRPTRWRSWPARSASTREGLDATVERFNGFAREGIDRDFRRGESALRSLLRRPRAPAQPEPGHRSRRRRSTRSRCIPARSAPRAAPRVDADAQVLRVRRRAHRRPLRGGQRDGRRHRPRLPGRRRAPSARR